MGHVMTGFLLGAAFIVAVDLVAAVLAARRQKNTIAELRRIMGEALELAKGIQTASALNLAAIEGLGKFAPRDPSASVQDTDRGMN